MFHPVRAEGGLRLLRGEEAGLPGARVLLGALKAPQRPLVLLIQGRYVLNLALGFLQMLTGDVNT